MSNYKKARQEWKKLEIKYYLPHVELDIEVDWNIAFCEQYRDFARELDEFYVWSESMGYLKREPNRDKGTITYKW